MKKIIILFLKFYHNYISPLFPQSCKFEPTCSNYAIEAIKKYGIMRGIALGTLRVLRCNPWNSGGYDPLK